MSTEPNPAYLCVCVYVYVCNIHTCTCVEVKDQLQMLFLRSHLPWFQAMLVDQSVPVSISPALGFKVLKGLRNLNVFTWVLVLKHQFLCIMMIQILL